ncbi:hypothetical protein T484DRAFT_1817593 [Baffinella frigidus]|nr:hypothetical protein T484DRAFT_1817593 [Cryptophyta sp. CCMP2293]
MGASFRSQAPQPASHSSKFNEKRASGPVTWTFVALSILKAVMLTFTGPVTWTFVALSVLKAVRTDLSATFGGDLSAAAAELFRTIIDVDHDGHVEAPQLRMGLERIGLHVSEGEAGLLVADIDGSSDGHLNAEQFADADPQMQC